MKGLSFARVGPTGPLFFGVGKVGVLAEAVAGEGKATGGGRTAGAGDDADAGASSAVVGTGAGAGQGRVRGEELLELSWLLPLESPM